MVNKEEVEMMKGYVDISENKEYFRSCNCCASEEEPPRLWDVGFTFNNHTILIKVCQEHLAALRNQADEALS